jgi:phosphatidylinositol glycan class M
MTRNNTLLYALALAVRFAVILVTERQEQFTNVKYTDIDYVVYSDAARFLANGSSPFERATFRYTPLLAYLMLPNVVWPAFGKVLFSACDLLVGALIHKLLLLQFAKQNVADSFGRAMKWVCVWLFNPLAINVSTRGNADVLVTALVLGRLSSLAARTQANCVQAACSASGPASSFLLRYCT